MSEDKYFVRIDFGNYAKEFKNVEKPVLSNNDDVKILRVDTNDGETHLCNWDKINTVTMKKDGGK